MFLILNKLNRNIIFQIIVESKVSNHSKIFQLFYKHFSLYYHAFLPSSAVINKVIKLPETTVFITYFIIVEIPGNKSSTIIFGTNIINSLCLQLCLNVLRRNSKQLIYMDGIKVIKSKYGHMKMTKRQTNKKSIRLQIYQLNWLPKQVISETALEI